MTSNRRALFPVFLALAVGCSAPLPKGQRAASLVVSDQAGAPLDALAPIVRLQVGGPRAHELVSTALLVEGTLSDRAAASLRRGELLASVAEREVPLSVWREQARVVVAPAEVLEAGETYTLAALGYGVLEELSVGPELPEYWRHVWPDSVSAGGTVVYCLPPFEELSPGQVEPTVRLQPGSVEGSLSAGVGPGIASARCVSVRLEQPVEDFVVPPLTLGGRLVEPLAIRTTTGESTTAEQECEAEDRLVDLGCAQWDGHELVVKSPNDVLWFVHGSPREGSFDDLVAWQKPHAGEVRFGPFEPNTRYDLSLARLDLRGGVRSEEAMVLALPPLAHVVVNEVLADALGPEPESEWVELHNAGTASAHLGGWVIEDAGGATVLPDVELEPGGFALVVNRTFNPDPQTDVVPAAQTTFIGVERLGQGGLANAGEVIRLRNSEGVLVSEAPGSPRPKAGISLARRDPWGPGDFALHAPPGASPGAPNQVDQD